MNKRELTEFGVLVKKRLVDLGQTQKELAKAIGVGEVYLNVILHGQRSGKRYVDAIANYLDIDVPATNYQQTSTNITQTPSDFH